MRISSICRVLYNPLAAIFDHQFFEKEEYIRLSHMGAGKARCVGVLINMFLGKQHEMWSKQHNGKVRVLLKSG
jgi:hypothetical protein